MIAEGIGRGDQVEKGMRVVGPGWVIHPGLEC